MRYLAVSAVSHDGLVRDHNEDSVVIGPWTLCATVTGTPQTLMFPLEKPVVVAVADGLGGHPAGELASSIVAQQLARYCDHLVDEAAVRLVADACNRAVVDEARLDRARAGMGTTVAGVVVTKDTVVIFNVGDSRVYAVRDGALFQVSVDDNPPLAPGQTHSSVVTQTLGGGELAGRTLDPHVVTHDIADGAKYLVCSDGLSDVVDDDEIDRLLGQYRGGEAVFELWKAAMEAGGPDNITIAVAEIATRD